MEILIVLMLALDLGMIASNQSLWLDEAISANVAKMPIGEILKNFSINDFHPPLYYWFLNIWTNIFGSRVAVLRFSSILFSVITVYFIYLIGKKIKNKKTGFLAALFLATNPLFVYFSQELRMYSMATMWLTIGFYYFIKIKNKKYKIRDLVMFNLMMALAFGTFYGSIFLIASFAIYWLIKKEWKLFWLTNIGIGLAIIILSPLLLTQIRNSQIMLAQVKNWMLVLGKVNFKNLLLIPLKFSVGRISFLPKIWYYLIGGSWSLIILALLFLKKKKESNWLKLFLILPIILAIIFSIKSPLLQYFRFLYLVPIMALILAINIDIKWQRMMVSGVFLIFSLIYLFNPNYYREDWKGMTNFLQDEKKVYMINSFSDPIKFYDPEIEIHDLREEINDSKIVVIPYGEEIHGIHHEDILNNFNYKKTKEINFREIEAEIWEKQL
ncbi:MAG: glycosyltransferase family 39 protein [Candidatus Shapirobacteria bacterium]|nr:glycosyltransferase family 39 protein [Candidatus Shapirobacteria bacterium]MDD4410814.1 glycosyltransferase family 39 protein [Candidatus Shapirobacteria bacterium]